MRFFSGEETRAKRTSHNVTRRRDGGAMFHLVETHSEEVCGPTWNIQIENFAPHKYGEQCRIKFVDPETSTVVASRSLDCRFVNQTTIRELGSLLNVNYRSELQRVVRLNRILQHASRRTAQAIRAIKKEG